jgi:hypothetical protein
MYSAFINEIKFTRYRLAGRGIRPKYDIFHLLSASAPRGPGAPFLSI